MAKSYATISVLLIVLEIIITSFSIVHLLHSVSTHLKHHLNLRCLYVPVKPNLLCTTKINSLQRAVDLGPFCIRCTRCFECKISTGLIPCDSAMRFIYFSFNPLHSYSDPCLTVCTGPLAGASHFQSALGSSNGHERGVVYTM